MLWQIIEEAPNIKSFADFPTYAGPLYGANVLGIRYIEPQERHSNHAEQKHCMPVRGIPSTYG